MANTILPAKRETLGLPDRRSVDIARTFAELSKKDLSASKALYDAKLYPQAVFHMQQAVEKGVKSVGLLMCLAPPTTDVLVRDLGHSTVLRILAGRGERLAQLKRNLGLLAASEGLKEGKEMFLKLGLPWAIPESAEMEARVTEEDEAKEEANRLQNLTPRDLWKLTLELNPKRPPNTTILKLLDVAEAQWGSIDKFERNFKRKLAHSMTDPESLRFVLNIYGKALPEVAPLAFFTTWHDRETRYPSVDESDYWDPRRYNARSGLVKVHPRLLKHANRLSDGAAEGADAAKSL